MPSPFIKELFMQRLKIDPKRTWHLKKTTKFTGEISQGRFETFFSSKNDSEWNVFGFGLFVFAFCAMLANANIGPF